MEISEGTVVSGSSTTLNVQVDTAGLPEGGNETVPTLAANEPGNEIT